MKSMTGFGRASSVIGGYTLTAQINSVNRKTLDLAIALPSEWTEFESSINDLVRKYATRGKINVRFDITGNEASQTQTLTWDEAAVSATLEKLATQSKHLGLKFETTPELLWSVVCSLRKKTDFPASESVQATVLATLEDALKAFSNMRASEGAVLLSDFNIRLKTISEHVASVAMLAPQVAPAWREQLLKRLREANLEIDLNDERILREVALFADRCDITEELTRLHSHIEQFQTLLHTEGEIGRKAEFILQEIGRETNTIGSKANNIEISRRVIELKNELERIREQIANIE